jgi:predicted patatin/cPLA2 family phospholipase
MYTEAQIRTLRGRFRPALSCLILRRMQNLRELGRIGIAAVAPAGIDTPVSTSYAPGMDGQRRGRSVFVVVVSLAGSGLAGCHGPQRPVPFEPPHFRALMPADDPCGCGGTSADMAFSPGDGAVRRPRHVLALSGGGVYGAYSAGFLSGWTCSGNRPEFDVVTGVSTGALIAPFAFLGPAYDAKAAHLYTRVQAEDIFRIRAWVAIPFKDAVASSAPLRELIESQITPDLMTRVAEEHRKGRRLYVGTTNLDTRRLVVWDLGAIACRPCPEGCRLFRDVLLASCAVPGMLPPVTFDLEVDGKHVTELHADGGVTAPLFVPSGVFAAAAVGAAEDAGKPGLSPEGANLYLVIAGKLYPDAAPVRRRVLPVLSASTGSLLYAHCRAECANLYGLAQVAGMRYHLTALRPGFETVDSSVTFDPDEMTKLFAAGLRQGSAGPDWQPGPPALSPGDADFIRTGVKLRTLPGPMPSGR